MHSVLSGTSRLISFGLLWAASAFGARQGEPRTTIFTQETEFSVAGKERNAGAVAWSPDGSQLAVLATLLRHATVFAVPSGDKLATITDLVGGPRAIGFAADGRVVIPGHRDDSAAVTLWNADTGNTVSVPGPDPSSDQAVTNMLSDFVLDSARTRLVGVHALKFRSHPNAAFAVAVYDTRTWTQLADHASNGLNPAISPDGTRVALTAAHGDIKVIDLATGDVLLLFEANTTGVKELAWSADGKRLASGAIAGGFGLIRATGKYGPLRDDNVLQLWDANTGSRMAVVRSEQIGGGVESLEFSSNNRWLATTTSDGTCRLWDATTLEPIETIATGLHPTTALARFSPDSRRLAVIRRGRAHATIYRAS